MEIITRKQAIELGLTTYFTGKRCKHNHLAVRWVSSMVCAECTSQRASTWRDNNSTHRTTYRKQYRTDNLEKEREYARTFHTKHKDRLNTCRRGDYHANPIKYMLYRAKERASKFNIPFNLEVCDVTMNDRCPVFNTLFSIGDYDNSPSLDRIIPELGYIRGNIIVISSKANRIKNNATWEDIEKVALFFKNHTNSKNL